MLVIKGISFLKVKSENLCRQVLHCVVRKNNNFNLFYLKISEIFSEI